MYRTYNTGIIACSQDSNALYIKLVNTSPSPNAIALTIYDYTDSTPRIAYNTTLYLSPKSIKGITFPLVAQNYDDCLDIRSYGIFYTTPNHLIRLSYRELSIDYSND